uniref:Uncharacterized protein n=1 Tax=Oryza barthii TaxID=65489 RepID=A0A0D3G994_9ORYZ
MAAAVSACSSRCLRLILGRPPRARLASVVEVVEKRRRGGLVAGAVELPFFAYLLASAITAIAAIGSIFEYANQRPVFGVVSPDSALYAPLLGFFVFTGIPTSGFLWFKAVQTANKEAEEQDRRDGFS